MMNFSNVWGPIQSCNTCGGFVSSVKEIENHICHLDKIVQQIRKVRDQFGDDKCVNDWHELFAMLPEGYARPKKDIRLRLEDCERYQKCVDACTEYVPPPRWVIGKPDKPGLWLVVIDDQLFAGYFHGAFGDKITKSFGPIPEAP